jgi:hypothetical protein
MSLKNIDAVNVAHAEWIKIIFSKALIIPKSGNMNKIYYSVHGAVLKQTVELSMMRVQSYCECSACPEYFDKLSNRA